MPEITVKTLILDVNETLLDLTPIKQSVANVLGNENFLPLWFSNTLHLSLVETTINRYHSFEDIGTASLLMIARANGICLSEDEAKDAIVTPLHNLPVHSDVIEGLSILSEHGFQIVCLTNSSASGMNSQLKYASLSDLIEKKYSVENVDKFKPHPDTYQMVLDDLNIKANEAMMVAAHGWDLVGAKKVGLKTAFIARPGKALYPIEGEPDILIKDFIELAELLITN